MKNKSIIGLFALLLGFGVSATSCQDMLTPEMDRYTENFSGRDTVNFYFGILANVQEMVENNVLLGDIRSDLVDTTSYVSDTVAALSAFQQVPDGDNGLLNRAAYYKVINQCNFYLAKVDSMAKKNDNYFMRRELAQVEFVRAWTYMQLVQNYGRVPFITVPVDNANTGWEKNPAEGWATADNLLDLLRPNLEKAYAYQLANGVPNYGTFNTGSVSIPHNSIAFDGDYIMGDMYLLRGASTSDYEKAATYYYHYLQRAADAYSVLQNNCSVMTSQRNGQDYYEMNEGSYKASFSQTVTNDIVSLIPSAANNAFGKTLTRVPQIYGFDPTSSTSTTSTVKSDGTTEYSSAGTIVLKANIKNRQLGASKAYQTLSRNQLVAVPKYSTGLGSVGSGQQPTEVVYPTEVGDGREKVTLADTRTDDGRATFIQKYCTSSSMAFGTYTPSSFSFKYGLRLYRLRQIWLRYAEAINRAGFPQHAYAVLLNGLHQTTVPALSTDSIKWETNAAGDTISGQRIPTAVYSEGGALGIDVNELRRAMAHPEYLDFSNNTTGRPYGIHAAGTGVSFDLDTLRSYANVVQGRIAAELTRVGTPASVSRKRAEEAVEQGEEPEAGPVVYAKDTIDVPEIADLTLPTTQETLTSLADQINAVETLISDEYALECCFEGMRYYDLYRIARHKNQDNCGLLPSNYGTNWFAWTLSRRSLSLKPYEEPTVTGPLYGKLLDQNNWYLQNPIY